MAQLWRSLFNCARFNPKNGAVHVDLRHMEAADEV
jgi:hypothetical protein